MTKQEIIAKAMEIPGMVSEWDLDLIYDYCQEYITENGYAFEIGGWKGRSTYVIASVCKEKNATFYELDTFAGVEDPKSRKNEPDNLNGYYEAFTNPDFIEIMKKNLEGLPVRYLKGDSKETIKELGDRTFDYCFIDGNHDFPFIDEDIKNSLMKIKIGGLLTGHDHGNPDTNVREAVERIFGTDYRVGEVRPLDRDPKYSLTIWSHIVNGKELE